MDHRTPLITLSSICSVASLRFASIESYHTSINQRRCISARILSAFVVLTLGVMWATVGHAQETKTLTLTPSGISLNLTNCESLAEDEEFTLSGTYETPSLINGYTVQLIATTQDSCNHTDVCNTVMLDEANCSCLTEVRVASASVSFKIADLFTDPCVVGSDQSVNFFLHYAESQADLNIGLDQVEAESQAVRLNIDLNPPSSPTEAPRVTPAEEALVINAPEVGGDVVRYQACVWLAEGEERADATCREVSADTNDRFEGLLNDSTYNVVYIAYDDADNPSEDSPIAMGTPASVLDFAEVYSGEYPGGERGGCEASVSSYGLGALVLLCLGVLAGRRRYMIRLAPLTFSALLLGATLSLPEAGHTNPLSTQRSDRTSTITLSGGAYQPNIDEEFAPRSGVQRPYERVFQDQSPLLLLVQLERHILQDVGLLSVGGSAGSWSVEGDGLSVTTVTETTELSITPLSLYAAYRLDLFQDIVPIVPTLKLGFSYYNWKIYDGGGDVALFADGSEASGGTMGWFYSIGVNFLLDFLDREMAWAFDRDAGVNHSYISFEYQSSQVDDFGDPDSFRLGNDVFLFGITLDI